MSRISRKLFERRLIDLVLSGPDAALPPRAQDRLILLVAICLDLDRRRAYTEREIDAVLEVWPDRAGGRRGLDRVTLRRALVDEGLLVRDRAGTEYRVAGNILGGRFDPAVLEIDAIECLEVEREARAMRKTRREEELGDSS